ncbi:MAG: DUF3047 domain-containing protein [Candidatus Omnitrophica bacterium]|nr:DUF3047 domain-containing protein [Candidatus Omnitrophota bacterium]
MPPRVSTPAPSVLWHEPFDALNPGQWREVEVRRHTQYRVAELEGRRCLEASSRDGASILLSPVRFDPDTHEWLSWEWRVDRFVHGEALDRKQGSDAAARVYVYFDTRGLPWQKRSMDYVWSASLPVGTILDSAFSSESKILVAESGTQAAGQWRRVERNLEDDYARAFGGSIPDVVAIGVMNDTDNTGGEALAYFDNLQVSREPSAATTEPR